MERIDLGQPFAVIVDYAHTTAALASLLGWVRTATKGRVLVVFGCGGDRDTGKRPEMGRVATKAADCVFITSDNPRGEDPGQILEQIAAGAERVAGGRNRCRCIEDRSEAIHAAIASARDDDLVVVAGKGHETTQARSGRERPFDDRRVARQTLEALGWRGKRLAGA